VKLYAIIGGGHNWPGVADAIPAAIAGQVNLDVHASDVAWSFFNRHQAIP
jgi:polyhydroxybutyrate depolymerase